MFHETRIKVRYVETDKMGIVHHSNHIVWWEVARVALMQDIGLPYGRMEAEGVSCPLKEIRCRYRQPAYFDDELVVRTAIADINPVKIKFIYEIVNCSTLQVIATGESVHPFASLLTGKPVRLDKSYPGMWKILLDKGRNYLTDSRG